MLGMARRSYGQFCGLAHALDVVGERWTLLLVRELSSGPKRYTELAEALSGIGTSLLATRVRQLEADGVIQRRLALDQPGSAVVYELSAAGRELAEAVIPLALWGARHQMADACTDSELFRAEWMLTFLAAELRDEAPHDLDALYEFNIGDSTACLRFRGSKVSVRPGKSATPSDVTVRATAPTIAALVGGKVTVAEAIAQDLLKVTGDPTAIATLLAIIEKRLANLTPA
ncbi:HxlR family transcriptional regulator [Mycolicibacterium cyprinidarum]|uniref:HxlR family transcriptional regulator n=1 Tax=Mycolicibacterium cyprinidarum TaxID=2860311 RepID=A0ABQ4VCA4_9MYCO|nr:HxlR family transcriptional regulator [Mycolicibacterium sp. NGTWS1803]GJF12812.1 HxlR family transcriptional regulator [Mycolicibacterium sp. NGTWS0302]GJF14092.1 HxlR family transcriptional regulator [Mycolicibacterium sp. NGTWSNA01]